ncbi:MAG: hypothetical protein SO098_00785, partial [Prevotella sp.]|nr:hypothetical protein [Prevotella sp.]
QARRPPHRFRPTPLVASLSMIFHYHLFIGEVRTIRNETTYPIHGKYPLNQFNQQKRLPTPVVEQPFIG